MTVTLIQKNTDIVKSCAWKKKIAFVYTNLKGVTSGKEVEVYDVSETFFYGWDLRDEKIKKFNYSQMAAITINDNFVPRFQQNGKLC